LVDDLCSLITCVKGEPLNEVTEYSRIAEEALDRYSVPSDSTLKLMNLSENATYLVESPSGYRSVLRVHRPNYHTREAITSELAWLAALRSDAGIVTAQTISDSSGNEIVDISSRDGQTMRYAVMFEFLSGEEPGVEDIVAAFEPLGEITAHLHAHSRVWELPAFFRRHTWDYSHTLGENPIWGRWADNPWVKPEALPTMRWLAQTLESRLAAFGVRAERFGLIHADLRLANLLVDGETTKVIDFDDCGFGWYLYDLAAALSFIEHVPQVPDAIESWLRGYRRRLPIASDDEAEIPTFVMLRRLLLVAWIGSHVETELAQEMGEDFVASTLGLAESYLSSFNKVN
jgi:Ser/Thr protein kinase RdoA (MazF antagonist)